MTYVAFSADLYLAATFVSCRIKGVAYGVDTVGYSLRVSADEKSLWSMETHLPEDMGCIKGRRERIRVPESQLYYWPDGDGLGQMVKQK
jgi:hypothetical protein